MADVQSLEKKESPTFTFVEANGRETPAKRHQNPDGTPGGWIAETAIVDRSAFVDFYAFVWPEAKVDAGTRVEGNCFKG